MRAPEGFAMVAGAQEVYVGKGLVVVCGDPSECAASCDHESCHNCDAMGCGSVGPHVIARYRLAPSDDAAKAAGKEA